MAVADRSDEYLDHLFWVVRVGRILGDVPRIRKVIRRTDSQESRPLVRGYQYLVRILMREYLMSFERDMSLGLETDIKTERSIFVGVDYKIRPLSSPLGIAVRNLHDLLKRIDEAKTLEEIGRSFQELDRSFLSPLMEIFDVHAALGPGAGDVPSREEMLRLSSLFMVWNFAHDIDRVGVLSTDDEDDFYLPQIDDEWQATVTKWFPGYKIGLALLWESLGDDDGKALAAKILSCQSWEDLENLSGEARHLAVDAPERMYSTDFIRSNLLCFATQPDVGMLAPILSIPGRRELTTDEMLDEELYWYQFDVLDSPNSKIFTGSPVLVSLIRGEVGERKENEVEAPLHVIRFRHPGSPPTFSYGVLMQRYGTLSDYSGWLVFMDVGGDYAGFGGHQYQRVEGILRRHRDQIEVREITIPDHRLDRFFEKKRAAALTSQFGSGSPSDRLRHDFRIATKRLGVARGLLMESLTAEFLRAKKHPEVHLRYRNRKDLGDLEIDVLALNAERKEAVLVECQATVSADEWENLPAELERKLERLKKSGRVGEGWAATKILVTSDEIVLRAKRNAEVVDTLARQGVELRSFEEWVVKSLHKHMQGRVGEIFEASKRPQVGFE